MSALQRRCSSPPPQSESPQRAHHFVRLPYHLPDVARRLQDRYPPFLGLAPRGIDPTGDDSIVPAATPQAMFISFWQYVQNEAPSAEQEAIIAELQQ